MYIEPNGVCHVLKDVPLDDTYEHTLWFDMDNKRSQYDYFISKKKYTFTGLTYTRYGEGIIIVQKPAEQMYDCNYIMFQNTGYGDKWFYAFITRVEYENNTTSTIYFQIDVMQTWHFDYTPKQCFVEREHSVTDVIGENLVPENLEKGAYITTDIEIGGLSGALTALVMVTELADGVVDSVGNENVFSPSTRLGTPTPCYILRLRFAGASTPVIKSITDKYAEAGKTNAIVAMFVVPFVVGENLDNEFSVYHNVVNCAERKLSNRTDGTKPKNNKLYTYPYCCLVASTGTNAVELRYELFDGAPKFILEASVSPALSVSCRPQYYEGTGVEGDYNNTISVSGYPLLAWVNNYYQNWVAQNKSRLQQSVETTLLSSLTGGLSAGVTASRGGLRTAQGIVSGVGVIGNTYLGIADVMREMEKAKILPNTLGGSLSSIDVISVSGQLDLRTYCRSIRPEFVTIIDDYFTRYGYATHLTKVPNRNSRPHFNFVKTVRATLTGSVPADDMRVICSIYDAGVTFWKNGDEVGDYDVDNRP